jgi:hypothetical protein
MLKSVAVEDPKVKVFETRSSQHDDTSVGVVAVAVVVKSD